jgi:hypothetical protein
MSAEELRELLLRAARRRTPVSFRLGGAVIRGSIGYVGEREVLILDRRTLRPMRVALMAIEELEVAS